MRRFLPAVAVLLLIAVCMQAGDKKKQQGLYVKPGQTADLQAPRLTKATQTCENWAVAAGLEAMLKNQGVALNQAFWVIRLNKGELCVDGMPSMIALAEVVNQEFVLDDGRHVRLELQFSPGAPTDLDSTIAGLQQQRLSLLFLRGHVYYLTGVTYDEYIGANGARMFIIKEMRLADTFALHPGLAFVNGRDNADDISGTLNVRVTWL
jgi:hypothetical protein